MTFDGKAVADVVGRSRRRQEGRAAGRSCAFEVEATMAVPPWVQGTLQADAVAALKTSIEGDLMGGPRYEQLFRATGSVRVGR